MTTTTSSAATPRPGCPFAHGQPFDPFSEAYAADAEPWLSRARAEAPVFFEPGLNVWCVTRYEDIAEALRHPDIFSSTNANAFRPLSPRMREVYPNGHPGEHSMLMKDPPEHTRIRKLANKALTPRAVSVLEPQIR